MKLSTKKIALFFVIFPLGFMNLSVNAQGENIVDNGGFETVEGKLKALGGIDNAVGWSSPTGARADIYTPSKILDINVPANFYGKEDAKEGTNYAGIVGFSYGDVMARTYIMAKLNTPLKKGMKYCVKFNISLSERSKYSSNKIGMKFSEKQFGTDSKTAIIEKTDVLDDKDKIFSAMYNWEQVCGEFIATGGEKFLTIGNFTSNENTKYEKIKKDSKMKEAQVSAAYYYIDDVIVTLITEEDVCDCGKGLLAEDNYSKTIYQKVSTLNDKMTPKEKMELQIIYFGFGKNKLTPEAVKSLDLIAALMVANPLLKLEIMGHSDDMEEKLSIEKPAFVDMGSKRISEVMKYLVSKGVAEANLISSPLGNSEPVLDTESDDEDLKNAKNRRTSFKVR